jgi:hypothetical protein
VAGGKALKEAGYSFDVAHTSLLTRAQVDTLPFHYGIMVLKHLFKFFAVVSSLSCYISYGLSRRKLSRSKNLGVLGEVAVFLDKYSF